MSGSGNHRVLRKLGRLRLRACAVQSDLKAAARAAWFNQELQTDMITLQSPLAPAACLERLEQVARPEAFWIDAAYDGPVYRRNSKGMDLRFKSVGASATMHKMLRMQIAPVGAGSRLDIEEGLWISRGWPLPGISFFVFFGLVSVRSLRALATLAGLSVLVALFAMVVMSGFGAFRWESQRSRLLNIIKRAVDVSPAG
jgi:hypothetical protein